MGKKAEVVVSEAFHGVVEMNTGCFLLMKASIGRIE